ncbi:hypothetical protein [Pseudomonas viridiflava]|uniref:hypothetical protein n=1 Tax=Pseudomonas viridiflava TaxID=33069 RepID=UPI000F0399C2|nr:hypothetical protein [Pseudomonas viridiflava]
MAGIEHSVTEHFRSDLRNACLEKSKVGVNAPLNGSDRVFNADEFFAIGERFFLVEFKSGKYSLKAENKKDSACTLCRRLLSDPTMVTLHDQSHFAAWSTAPKDKIECQIGIYRSLVCCKEVMKDCIHVQHLSSSGKHSEAHAYLVDNIEAIGIEAKDFKTYVQWLMNNTDEEKKNDNLPLTLYTFSYTAGIKTVNFKTYSDLFDWSERVNKYSPAASPAAPTAAVQSKKPTKRKNQP